MSNTRKTVKRPSSAADFKKRNARPMELPSGLVIEVKNPGLMNLAHQGLIPNSLMSIIQDAISKGRQPSTEEVMSDGVELSDMAIMVDRAVMACCVNPKVHPVPVDPEDPDRELERDDDLLYVDEIEDEDKMFLFQWITGGTTDLEQFRRESRGVLGTLSGQPAVVDSTK